MKKLKLPKPSRHFFFINTVIILLALISLIAIYLLWFNQADAAWFNDGWGYRQVVTVTVTSSASDISSLQTLVTIDTGALITAGKLQSSCQDLRFTSQSGKILPYYIDSGCNGASTKVWVLADLVPKNTTTYLMYMYYGNPSAAAGSSATPTNFNLVQGLAGYWTGNESSWNGTSGEVKDSSVNGNNGTASGGVTTTTGKYGNSGDWDGANDSVSLGSPAAVDNLPANGMTFTSWIYPDTLGQSNVGFVTAKNTGSGQNQGWFLLNYATNTLQFVVDGSTDLVVQTSNNSISLGAWNHIALSWNGDITNASSVHIYVNGVEVGYQVQTNGAGRVDDASSSLFIGNSSAGDRTFDGKIDDYRLYNRALSGVEINQLYNNPGSITTTATTTSNPTTSFSSEEKGPSPVLYWQFDEAQGTSAEDSTANALDGTLTDGPAYQAQNLCISGFCLYFAGTDDNVNIADNAKLDFAAADNFTVSAWVKRNGTASANTVILQKTGANIGSTYTGYKLYMDASGDFCFAIQDGTNAVDSACTTAVDFDDNQWHFVTGVKAATTSVTLYVDGKQRAQDASIASTGTLANASTLRVGVDSDGTSNDWLGFIDEVKVFRDNTARTTAQVTSDYNARSNPEGVSQQEGNNTQNNPAALSNGLVGYWKTDESSGNAADSSGNANTLTNNNTTTYTTGKFDKSATFVRTSSQSLSVADGSQKGLEGMTGLTISLWVNPTSFNDDNNMVVKDNTNGQCSFLINYGFNGQISFFSCSSGFYGGGIPLTSSADGVLTVGTWTHITITSSGGVARLYKNGVEQVSGSFPVTGTSSTIFNSTSAFSIGGGTSNGSANYTNGKLDEVRIYNRSLTASEVFQLYNWAPSPVGYWRLDEGTGSIAYDQSGSANNGTVTAATYSNDAKYGKSLSFDGSGDFVDIPNSTSLNVAGELTVEAWVKPTNLNSTYQDIFTKMDNVGCNSPYELGFADNNNLYLSWAGSGCSYDGGELTTFSFSNNTWYHVAATRQSNDIVTFYINGVKYDGTQSGGTVTVPTNSTYKTAIGRAGELTGQYFNGRIDEVKIYNYVRSTGQIVEDMNAGHPAPGSPVGSPVTYWKFDEGYGTAANNSGSGGSGYSGTLSSFSSPAISTSGWTTAGKLGKALSFDGSSDIITASGFAADFFTTNWSQTFWIKTTQSGNNVVTEKGSNQAFIQTYNGQIRTGTASGVGNVLDTTGAPLVTDGSWHHIAVTYDSVTNLLVVYIDGINRGSLTTTNDASSSATAYSIGARVGPSVNFLGQLDEVKVFDSALTADQVKMDINQSSAQVLGTLSSTQSVPTAAASEYCIPGDSSTCTSPVARWDFEEGTGTTVNDSSGNAYTVTNTGADYQPGKWGKGLYFDGADYGTGPNDLEPPTAITISAWIKVTGGAGTFRHIITKPCCATWGNPYAHWDLRINSSNQISLGIHNVPSTTFSTANGTTTMSADGVWKHVAGTFDGTVIKVYLNGKLEGSTNLTSTIGTSGTENIAVGTRHTTAGQRGEYFVGSIDALRVFDYSRTAAQIAWDYNKGAPLAQYKIDECQGTVLNNSVSSTFAGTITIGASGSNTTVGTCTTSGAWFDGVVGKRNYSIDLDGTDDYITLADASSFPANNAAQSISAWLYYPTTPGSTATAVSLVNTGSTSLTALQIRSGNIGVFKWGGTTLAATTQPAQATWNHVVYTFDGTTHSLYLNGRLANTSTTAANTATPAAAYLGDYTASGGERWPGQIDDVRIFNYSLTPQQAYAVFNDGTTRYGPVVGAP